MKIKNFDRNENQYITFRGLNVTWFAISQRIVVDNRKSTESCAIEYCIWMKKWHYRTERDSRSKFRHYCMMFLIDNDLIQETSEVLIPIE